MKNQELLAMVRSEVAKLKATGSEGISLADLDAYLANIQTRLETLPPEAQNVSPIKIQHDFSLAQYGWQKDSSLEMFRSVITTGQSALKASMLLNGGAAVALLAFIGHAAESTVTKIMVSALALPLFIFVTGALVAAVATGGTYLSQSLYHHKQTRCGTCVNILNVVFVALSYILFCWASYGAYLVFLKF